MERNRDSLSPGELPDLGSVRQVSGWLDARGLRFGIVASRFNADLTRGLVQAALEALYTHGATERDVVVVWVPGAFEIPSVLPRLARQGGFNAFLALGTVLRGETEHAGMINRQVSRSLAELSRSLDKPVIYEVVPAETRAQAVARCLGGRNSRGWYAAEAAIEMARVFEQLPEPS